MTENDQQFGKSTDDMDHELEAVQNLRDQPFRKTTFKPPASKSGYRKLDLAITRPDGVTGVLTHVEHDGNGQLVAKVRWAASGMAFSTYPARWGQ